MDTMIDIVKFLVLIGCACAFVMTVAVVYTVYRL